MNQRSELAGKVVARELPVDELGDFARRQEVE